MVHNVQRKKRAARRGPVGDVPHLSLSSPKGITDPSTEKGSPRSPRSGDLLVSGCTGTHVVVVRNHPARRSTKPSSANPTLNSKMYVKREEYVEVEDMEHRYSQPARWRSELETVRPAGRCDPLGQQAKGRNRTGHRRPSKEAEEGAEREGSFSAEASTWPVTGSVRSSWWSLCRSSPGRAMARPESGSSQAGHQSSDPGEGGASLVASKRTRRRMAPADSR